MNPDAAPPQPAQKSGDRPFPEPSPDSELERPNVPRLGIFARAPRLAGRAMIQAYRHTLSPLIGFHCRHLPTCSDYADQAIGHFGLWAGGWMTLARLGRCQPWGTSGLDFVPPTLPLDARWYMPWRYGRWRGTNADAAALGRGPPAGA